MNIFNGEIISLETEGSITIVVCSVGEANFKTIVIDTPETAPYLKVGHPVSVLFKETEVVIGVGSFENISLQNRIEGRITKIDKGKLISKLTIESKIGLLDSIITSGSVERLKLNLGTEIVAMIKTNEILISEL